MSDEFFNLNDVGQTSTNLMLPFVAETGETQELRFASGSADADILRTEKVPILTLEDSIEDSINIAIAQEPAEFLQAVETEETVGVSVGTADPLTGEEENLAENAVTIPEEDEVEQVPEEPDILPQEVPLSEDTDILTNDDLDDADDSEVEQETEEEAPVEEAAAEQETEEEAPVEEAAAEQE
ncbi:hypothetical protein, partial [Dapis sp. BLCC M172]|uniref:hypothetical protein n=1 Tax=Dapis sp. BLCC M172 TaxID=2975281 RepID=UPI003CE7836F